MSEVVLVMGCPASGKSTYSDELVKKDYVYLNRDTAGGKVISLVPKLEKTLKTGSNAVLDNLYATRESRKPFIEAAKAAGVRIRCIHVNTSIEDAQINALHRMWKRYGRLYLNQDELKGVK